MTNFTFSRRDIQRCIDRLAAVLDSAQLARLIGLLNKRGRDRLPAMWEVVVLDALSREAELRHEVALPSGRKPDLEVVWRPPGSGSVRIVGDIATVSDTGLDEANPIDVLFQESARIATRLGVHANHLGYRVDGHKVGARRDERMQLPLPAKNDLIAILNGPFKAWLTQVGPQPSRKATFDYDKDGHRFSISIDPTQRYSSGSYTSYDVAISLQNNPLFRALRAKRKQLRGAPSDATRLIIACDGDCATFSRSSFSSGSGTYSAKEIASHFLNGTSGIDAVLLVTVDSIRPPLAHSTQYKLRLDLVTPSRAQPKAERVANDAELQAFLSQAASYFPAACQSPINAFMRCRDMDLSRSHNGAFKMNSGRISISSRGLLDLLSGEISSDQFHALQTWNDPRFRNLFEAMRSEGRLIKGIRVEPMDAPDDDWLTFEFGEPDPAASPFVAPRDAKP